MPPERAIDLGSIKLSASIWPLKRVVTKIKKSKRSLNSVKLLEIEQYRAKPMGRCL